MIRTNQCRKMGIIAVFSMALVYLLIFYRWRVGCLPWEAAYLVPFGITMGILLSTQFIGMTSTVPKERLGQCIGTFYLFQQLGRIIGPAFGLKLIDRTFERSLQKRFDSEAYSKRV
jgi:MFS family permease